MIQQKYQQINGFLSLHFWSLRFWFFNLNFLYLHFWFLHFLLWHNSSLQLDLFFNFWSFGFDLRITLLMLTITLLTFVLLIFALLIFALDTTWHLTSYTWNFAFFTFKLTSKHAITQNDDVTSWAACYNQKWKIVSKCVWYLPLVPGWGYDISALLYSNIYCNICSEDLQYLTRPSYSHSIVLSPKILILEWVNCIVVYIDICNLYSGGDQNFRITWEQHSSYSYSLVVTIQASDAIYN